MGIVCRNKARIAAIRLFLAFASFMGFRVYQMDVKSAFLYGKIAEEVYVTQPKGFEDPDHPKKVYKVVKALYGLHQAPKACDYAGAKGDRKSTTGGCQFLGRRGKIDAIDADEDITLVDVETQVDMDAELQGRIDQDINQTLKHTPLSYLLLGVITGRRQLSSKESGHQPTQTTPSSPLHPLRISTAVVITHANHYRRYATTATITTTSAAPPLVAYLLIETTHHYHSLYDCNNHVSPHG
nr:putative ribonuclease H-like domain-containing protein [Tanacetum cinerariifolium]